MVNAAICDPADRILVDRTPTHRAGLAPVTPANDLDDLIDNQGSLAQLSAIYTEDGRQVRVPAGAQLGAIRSWARSAIGVSTWLLRDELVKHLRMPLFDGGRAVLIASIVGRHAFSRSSCSGRST